MANNRQKMITLCTASWAEAQTVKPNFSAWVRKQLLNTSPKVSDMSDRQLVAILHSRMVARYDYGHKVVETLKCYDCVDDCGCLMSQL